MQYHQVFSQWWLFSENLEKRVRLVLFVLIQGFW